MEQKRNGQRKEQACVLECEWAFWNTSTWMDGAGMGWLSRFAIDWAGDREKWSPHGHGSPWLLALTLRHWRLSGWWTGGLLVWWWWVPKGACSQQGHPRMRQGGMKVTGTWVPPTSTVRQSVHWSTAGAGPSACHGGVVGAFLLQGPLRVSQPGEARAYWIYFNKMRSRRRLFELVTQHICPLQGLL